MLYTFSSSPLDLNILCPKEETEVPRGCDWRLVGPVGGGSPLRGPELPWSRSPRLPNLELAPQSELGVLGCRLRVTPGWLSPEAEESKGREVEAWAWPPWGRGMTQEGVRLPCPPLLLSHHTQGTCPRAVTAAADASSHSLLSGHQAGGRGGSSCHQFSIPWCSGGTRKVVSGPGQPVKGRTESLGGSESPPSTEGKCREVENTQLPFHTHTDSAHKLESKNKDIAQEAWSK